MPACRHGGIECGALEVWGALNVCRRGCVRSSGDASRARELGGKEYEALVRWRHTTGVATRRL